MMMLMFISAWSGASMALRGGSWPGPSGTASSSSTVVASQAAAAGTAAHMLPLRPVAVPAPATTNTARPYTPTKLYSMSGFISQLQNDLQNTFYLYSTFAKDNLESIITESACRMGLRIFAS